MVLACFEFGVSETAFVCTSFVSSDDTRYYNALSSLVILLLLENLEKRRLR